MEFLLCRCLDYFADPHTEARLIAQDRRIVELERSKFTIIGRLNYVSILLLMLQVILHSPDILRHHLR